MTDRHIVTESVGAEWKSFYTSVTESNAVSEKLVSVLTEIAPKLIVHFRP